jgi:hypothetical protein
MTTIMRAVALKVAIPLFILTVAGVIAGLWRFERRPFSRTYDLKPSLTEPITMPAVPSCFPGRSTEISRIQVTGHYFPQDVPRFFVEWFSKHLRAMDEPSLRRGNAFEETYRFLWLRSFHRPIAVRVWRAGDRYFLVAKELDGAGGYAPGNIIVNKSRQLTSEEWITFMRLLEQSCFWNLAPEDTNTRGNDGAEWVVEGVKQGRYHVADVWTPNAGAYHDACIYLLKIAELGIDERSKDLY